MRGTVGPNESRERLHNLRAYRWREFLRRLAEKCDDDEVLFMAGAIAFDLVIALFPLVILGIGIAGLVLSESSNPTTEVVAFVTALLPQGVGGVDLNALVSQLTQGLLERRIGFTIAGSVFLLWVATRLSSSLRVALREIFDIGVKRNPLHGKLFDVGAVVVGILLLTLNLGVTVVVTATVAAGESVFGLGGDTVSFAERMLAIMIAFSSIWLLLLLAYRYVPSRRIPWRVAVVAATFTAFSHESLKVAFSWYATEVADYGTTLGNLATVGVLFFWIYYESVVFILGGEVAQVYSMRRASRVGVVSFEEGS